MTDKDDRLEAGREIVRAKQDKGLTWAELAATLDRSLVWTTSALLGQQPLDADQAKKIGDALDLDEDTVDALTLPRCAVTWPSTPPSR